MLKFKIDSLESLIDNLEKETAKLYPVMTEYLNTRGIATILVFNAVLYYAYEHISLEGLSEDKDFLDLLEITDQSPEYYEILKELIEMIKGAI